MADKKSFVMYASWAAYISELPSEQAAQLAQAICRYQLGKDVMIKDPAIKAFFEAVVLPEMKENDKKYQEKVARVNNARGKRDNTSEFTQDQTENSQKSNRNQDEIRLKSNRNQDEIRLKSNRNQDEINSDTDTVTDTVTESGSVSGSGTVKDKNIGAHARPVRHKHGNFGHVFLTEAQFETLVSTHGEKETEDAIQCIDDYCEQSGKTYKNYALVLEKWGYRSAAEQNARSGTTRAGTYDQNDYLLEQMREAEAAEAAAAAGAEEKANDTF